MRKWSLIVIGMALAFALGAALNLRSRRASAEANLEAYQAELRSRGEKLTYEELDPTLDSDRRVDLSRFLAVAAELPTERAGLGDLAVMRYVAPGGASAGWMSPRPPFNDYVTHTGVTWSDLNQRVDAAAAATRELHQCVADPSLRLGRPFQETMNRRLSDELILKRQAARWLAGSVVVELHRGRAEEAFECLDTLLGIAQMQRQEFHIVTQMVRVALGSLAMPTTWELLQTNGLTEPQLAHLQARWTEADYLEALERGLLAERAHFLWSMAELEALRSGDSGGAEHGGVIGRLTSGAHSVLWHPAREELFYLQNLQPLLEGIRTVSAHQSAPTIEADLANLGVTLERAEGSLFRYRYSLSLMSLPTARRAVPRALEIETQRRMTLVAIALSRYSLAHGGPPPSLELLVPDFLPAVPLDPMVGEPFRYRLHPDHTFTLYSVGRDGIDNGGDSSPAKAGAEPGFWEGRDTVWPSSVRETHDKESP